MDDDGDTQMVIAEVTDAWDDELYEEYRVIFSDDQWREETEQSLYPAVVGRYNAMPFFEKEKPYDLMLSTLYILLKAADELQSVAFCVPRNSKRTLILCFLQS